MPRNASDCLSHARRPAQLQELRHAYEGGRVALYHSSDAIALATAGRAPGDRELGNRYVLVKLATPSLEALRQAFLGRDSRLRIPYVRDPAGGLAVAGDLPAPLPQGRDARPWIREIRVEGGASFLRGQSFRLSPDLSCLIGGSMTGKSTLLDGLRFWFGGESVMPDPKTPVGRSAIERARDVFLAGGTQIELESPAGDLVRPAAERFSPRFYSQGELKSLAEDDDGIEHLLFHLVPGRAAGLSAQRDALLDLDRRISDAVPRLVRLHEQVAEVAQEPERTADARAAMEQFAQAGTATLPAAQQDVARARAFARDVQERSEQAREMAEGIDALALPGLGNDAVAASLSPAGPEGAQDAALLLQSARTQAAAVVAALRLPNDLAKATEVAAEDRLKDLTAQVQAALVAAGRSADDINQLEAFARIAQHYDSFLAAHRGKQQELDNAWSRLETALAERDRLVRSHREAVEQVCREVEARFQGRVQMAVVPQGHLRPLETWVTGLRNAGLTRWWNSGGSAQATPTKLGAIVDALGKTDRAGALRTAKALGMSDAVAGSLFEQLATWRRQLEVRVLRCPDRYRIRWGEDGESKELSALSGGRRVAVLLSLILESDDSTPLFVDQPEDELDNRFLNETIIPALHRLKGKRQVVFATHNANLVVNGDADQVIALEADAHHGKVYAAGAIEDSEVRSAIVRTLDGGADAFRLRRSKYGY